MAPDPTYALLDCGDGRRLERFGGLLADRPAPAAGAPRRVPDAWRGAAAFYPASGWWADDGTPLPEAGSPVTVAGLTLEARPAAGGQVGLFPEHVANVGWLEGACEARVAMSPRSADGRATDAPEVLNLFAYTGLLTLVAARAGARVVHLDASRPAVAWARRNAELSGLADRPVRWIVDDALAFVRRESRRGRRYAGIVLDPPTYGHGGRGGRPAWGFDDGIMELLDACAGIADPSAFWLLTTHSPGWDPGRLTAVLGTATDAQRGEVDGIELAITAESGAVLRLGAAARFDPLGPNRR